MPRATKNSAEPAAKKPRTTKPKPDQASAEVVALREQMALLATQVAALTQAMVPPVQPEIAPEPEPEPVAIEPVTPEEHEAIGTLLGEIEQIAEPEPAAPVGSRLPPPVEAVKDQLDRNDFEDEMLIAFADPQTAEWPDTEEDAEEEPFEEPVEISQEELEERWPDLMKEVSEFNGSVPEPQIVAETEVQSVEDDDDRRSMSNEEIQSLLAGLNPPEPEPAEPARVRGGDIVTAAEIEAMLGLGGGLDLGVNTKAHEQEEPETAPVESADEAVPELELIETDFEPAAAEPGESGDALAAVPARLAASLLIFPLRLDGKTLHCLTPDPACEEDIWKFRLETGLYVEVSTAPIEEVVDRIREAYGSLSDPAAITVDIPTRGWRKWLTGGRR